MTQISGQIYQMHNGKTGAQRVNRFPVTVMEAVLGLNSYLQNQFSSLADIYMPIEGITESKPLQEFVYRLCPSTIKAKSLTLDRIYGKTLAWNQLVQNGNFENGTDNWYNAYGSITFSVNHIVADIGSYVGVYSEGMNIIAGHKYYCSIKATSESNNHIHVAVYSVATATELLRKDSVGDNTLNAIKTAETTGVYDVRIEGIESPLTVNVFYANVIDLTLMFGAGNEPSTVAEFESMFPGYHEAGNKLISNDAESIETVGFNVWDEEWEIGAYDSQGEKQPTGGGYLIPKNLIPVLPGTTYYSKIPYSSWIREYDANGKYLDVYSYGTNNIFTTTSQTYFVTFEVYGNNPWSTYNHDICINLSDESKNGTYEPYRKSVMQLGLGNLKVKSHNIWDEEWEVISNAVWSKNFIEVTPGEKYYGKFGSFTSSDVGYIVVAGYDSNGTMVVNTITATPSSEFTIPSNVSKIKFYMSTAYGQTYNNDICINVSSSFNGQYEPHGILTKTGGLKGKDGWNDVLYSGSHLDNKAGRVNLGELNWYRVESATSGIYFFVSSEMSNFKIQGSNGIIWPNLILGAGYEKVASTDIYNGIAPNKSYGGYDGNAVRVRDDSYSDAATFKAAMNGVYLDYELATPIEYELVSPLVPTVKAGITEARISPNSDGLSAPMVADMTYDAQANNDSASAQYALTAGRLLNSHKLWGQDFDGTQDVAGALTGVTSITMNGALSGVTSIGMSGAGTVTGIKSIDSLLYFDTTNSLVGIGTNSPASKLDIHYNSASILRLVRTTTGSAACIDLCGGNQTTNFWRIIADNPANAHFSIAKYIGSTESKYLTVENSGKISIPNTLSVTGAATFGSTLTVTGLTSIAGGLKLTTTKKIWFDDTHYLELLTENNTPYLHTNLNVVSEGAVVARAAANS